MIDLGFLCVCGPTMQTYKSIFYFCCFLLSEPLHLVPLLSLLGITADALAPLPKECSDAQNTSMFAGAHALGLLHSLGVKVHVSLYFVHHSLY